MDRLVVVVMVGDVERGWCYLLWLCTNHDRRCLLLTLTRYAGVPSLWNVEH